MYVAKFTPQIFTVVTNDGLNDYTWELLTLDGENPSDTIYFHLKGDYPSSCAVDQIENAIEDEEWDVRPASDEDVLLFNIDRDVLKDYSSAYTDTSELLGRLMGILFEAGNDLSPIKVEIENYPKADIYEDETSYFIDLRTGLGAGEYPKDSFTLEQAIADQVNYTIE